MYIQKVISRKNTFVGVLKVKDEISRIRIQWSEARIHGSETYQKVTTDHNNGLGNPLMIIVAPTIAVQLNCLFPSKEGFTGEENRIYHQIYQTIEQLV
jgi:hypothetical protein